jgi:hypothetical protein
VRKTVEALEGGQLLRVQLRQSKCRCFRLYCTWTYDTTDSDRRGNSRLYMVEQRCLSFLLPLGSVVRRMLSVNISVKECYY